MAAAPHLLRAIVDRHKRTVNVEHGQRVAHMTPTEGKQHKGHRFRMRQALRLRSQCDRDVGEWESLNGARQRLCVRLLGPPALLLPHAM